MRDDSNHGILFLNNNRRDKHSPHYVGDVTVEGKKYKLFGRNKTGKNGAYFMSIQVRDINTPPDEPLPEEPQGKLL